MKTDILFTQLDHLAVTDSDRSPTKARRTHQLGGDSTWGRQETRIRHTHTPPNVFYCICPVSTQ